MAFYYFLSSLDTFSTSFIRMVSVVHSLRREKVHCQIVGSDSDRRKKTKSRPRCKGYRNKQGKRNRYLQQNCDLSIQQQRGKGRARDQEEARRPGGIRTR